MSHAYSIGKTERRQTEALSAFRYHAEQTMALYQEACWVWSDGRGKRFAVTALEPQAAAMEMVRERLVQQAARLAEAQAIAEAAERAIAASREFMETAEETAARSRSHVRESQDIAGHALAGAGRVRSGCQAVMQSVAQLGAPPI